MISPITLQKNIHKIPFIVFCLLGNYLQFEYLAHIELIDYYIEIEIEEYVFFVFSS